MVAFEPMELFDSIVDVQIFLFTVKSRINQSCQIFKQSVRKQRRPVVLYNPGWCSDDSNTSANTLVLVLAGNTDSTVIQHTFSKPKQNKQATMGVVVLELELTVLQGDGLAAKDKNRLGMYCLFIHHSYHWRYSVF